MIRFLLLSLLLSLTSLHAVSLDVRRDDGYIFSSMVVECQGVEIARLYRRIFVQVFPTWDLYLVGKDVGFVTISGTPKGQGVDAAIWMHNSSGERIGAVLGAAEDDGRTKFFIHGEGKKFEGVLHLDKSNASLLWVDKDLDPIGSLTRTSAGWHIEYEGEGNVFHALYLATYLIENEGYFPYDLASLTPQAPKEEPPPESQEVQLDAQWLQRFKGAMAEQVKGQHLAIDRLEEVMQLVAANLNPPNKPLAVLMFVGPTGVGKTETAHALARLIGRRKEDLLVLDMAEFTNEWDHSKLIGSSIGLIGSDEGGILTNTVLANPKTIVVLDEFEKAHHMVQKFFLGLFDAARVTTGRGQQVDFSKTLIIMTSNANAEGFAKIDWRLPSEELTKRAKALVAGHFPPELLGRVEVIPFRSLNRELLAEILQSKLDALALRTRESHGFEGIHCSAAATDRLLQLGTDLRYGARPLMQALERGVLLSIARSWNSGRLTRGDRIAIDWDGSSFSAEPILSTSSQADESESPKQSSGS